MTSYLTSNLPCSYFLLPPALTRGRQGNPPPPPPPPSQAPLTVRALEGVQRPQLGRLPSRSASSVSPFLTGHARRPSFLPSPPPPAFSSDGPFGTALPRVGGGAPGAGGSCPPAVRGRPGLRSSTGCRAPFNPGAIQPRLVSSRTHQRRSEFYT